MIPEGWKLSIVGHHTNLLSGFAFKSKEYTDSHDGIRLLRGDNIAQGNLRWRGAKLWSQNKVKKLDKYYLNEGDFVIAMDRTWIPAGVKVSQVQESDLPCLLVQRVSRLRANPSFLQELLKQHFFSHRFEQYVKKVQTETAVPHISPTDIREFPILVPPLPEQKKIAQILSTWDKAIETVEKLIENSSQKKKALMQQLLTGKKRFPEFDGEWKDVRLGELCKFMKGKGLSKGKLSDSGQYKCILYGELYTRYSEVIGKVVNRTDYNEGVKSESGDVLIPASTTTSGIDLANATSLKESGVLLSGDINILRTDKDLINPDFFAHILTHVKKHDLARRAQGITIIHLYGKDIKHIKIMIPSLTEQEKIVSIIASGEQETKTWQQELTHLKQEKKALMQQLLTGKRQVKAN